MLLRFAVIGGGLLLLALIPALAEVVSSASSRRSILHCLAGEELLAAGWLLPAEREFRRALKLQPLLGAAHCGLARVRMQQHLYDDAVLEYWAAIAALQKVDQSLGSNRVSQIPATLTSELVEALDRCGRSEEAAAVRRSQPDARSRVPA